jgi:signal transduction histidine kinase/FixJ family two-component response regulator
LAAHAALVDTRSRRQEILSAQVRLLSANASLGAIITVLAATILAYLQWGVVSISATGVWWTYMTLVAVSRYMVARRFLRISPGSVEISKWRVLFAVWAGLAGAGWGGAAILLYPETHLANQVFLVFVVGGMMLGAASLLAPRPEAFLAFLLPAGLIPSLRFLLQGDETHVAMAILAAVFTVAVVITTGRIYRTVDSSLRLQFENRDLVEDLQAAKNQTEALNQVLELRVEARTAELRQSTEQLRAEIAHRQSMEEELLRVRKLESLGVLAGGIAHDFNNFLTVVQGNIEVAKESLGPGEPVQEILSQTASACQRAAALSSQLLTFAKGGAPVRRLISIGEIIIEAVHLVRAGASIKLSVDIADDLWLSHADPGQISQVFYNILLNARQAMPDGGIIEVRAENAVRQDPGDLPSVNITIRDDGCGIPPDVIPRIFDPYFTTTVGGTGLGLATAYAIVAGHGGRISVESKTGAGTIFTIELPASHDSAAGQAPVPAQTQRGTERLLVMDDEEALRSLLKTVLAGLGYEVQTAGDGAEAIALCEREKARGLIFDAVLLDLTVRGGMGGIEAAAKLKELDPSLRLIVSSGYSDAPVMSDFARYGFDAVVPKPWTASEISDAFRRVLAARPEPAARPITVAASAPASRP